MVLLTDEGAELRTVGDFLAYARLESAKDNYAALLSEEGVDEVVEEVLDVTDEQLQRWGMKKEMHRFRFLKFACKCRPQSGGSADREERSSDAQQEEVAALREEIAAQRTRHEEENTAQRTRHEEEIAALRKEIAAQRTRHEEEIAALRTRYEGGGQPHSPPSTPERVESQSVDLPHLFVSHSRRDPGALNAARLFAYALKHAVDRVFQKPFCEACYIGPHGGPQRVPQLTLWFDKEAMSTMGGAAWPEVLAAKQHEAVATICFLGNAYLGSSECVRELQFADTLLRENQKPLIPFFLESFVNSQEDFDRKKTLWRCDSDLRKFEQWAKKKQYARKAATCLQGVPAYFEDLSVFTCDKCRGKKDTACSTCTSWETVSSGIYSAKAEQSAAMLGKYIDHLHFQGTQDFQGQQYAGPTKADGSPDLRSRRAREFEASQSIHTRSVSVEETGLTSVAPDVLSDVNRLEVTSTTPLPRGAFEHDFAGSINSLSTLDLDAQTFPMHPSLTYFLQDMIDEKGTFRDSSGQEFQTVQQCVPLKMVPIELWNAGSQKTHETLDGSEATLVLRRRGYGPSAGYGGGRNTSAVSAANVQLPELLGRRPTGRGRATVVLGPAASGKTMMMHRLFVEQATKAMKCKNSAEIVAPYILRVAELAKWLNGRQVTGDLDVSTLHHFLQHQHGGPGAPLATELIKLLDGSRLTLLFDGLDEAGEKQKGSISRFIGNTLRSHFDGAIVVTSRESLFVGTDFKSNFDLVQIQPLSKELQQQIVELRFTEAEVESKNKFFEESASLPEEMLENPLLLTMLVGVFKREGRLSRTRSDLYDNGIRQLILGRHAEQHVSEIVEFLRSLGHLVHVELKKRDFTEAEVQEHLGERSKLLTLCSRAKAEEVDSIQLERALQSDDPEDQLVELMVKSLDGSDEQKARRRRELENTSTVFDRAWETGLLMCVDMNNSEDRTFRFTHLTFQEALAAARCLEKLRAHQESVSEMFKVMFGTAPDPWLREVLLMTAEQLDGHFFEELADCFLNADTDDGTGANAVQISTMLTARGENLQNPSPLGERVLGMLSKLRSTEFMASTLQCPSEQLRRLALKEIEAYTMPKAEISKCLLQKLQAGSTDTSWYVQAATVRSLGTLQVGSQDVGSFLVDICFDRRWHSGVVMEAVRALGHLELENQDYVVSKVLDALDTEQLRATAVKTLISPLRICDERIDAKLRELIDQRKLSDDVVVAAQALAQPVVITTENTSTENYFSAASSIKLRSPKPEPEPEPEPEAGYLVDPNDGNPLLGPEPELDSKLQSEPQPESSTPGDLIDVYEPLAKVRKVIDKLLQDRSALGGTDSINGGMEILQALTPTLRCMGVAQELAQNAMVRDQFEEFMAGETGWWIGSLCAPAEQSTDSDQDAAAKVVWFFHELSLRLLMSDIDGWQHEETATKTIGVRNGERYAVGELATFRGGGGDVRGRVLSIIPDPKPETPNNCKITVAVTPNSDSKPAVPENVELLAHQFLELLEMDYKEKSTQTVKLLFSDFGKVGVEIGRLDKFVRPHFDQLVGHSPMRAFSFCSVLHYLRYHNARLLKCDPNGNANARFRGKLEDEFKRMPQQLAVFLRKEMLVGSFELDRPYWIESEDTQIEIVNRNQSGSLESSDDAPHHLIRRLDDKRKTRNTIAELGQPTQVLDDEIAELQAQIIASGVQMPQHPGLEAGSGANDVSDAVKQEATLSFTGLMGVEVAEAQGFLEHRDWNVEQAISDYLAIKESQEKFVPEGVPPDTTSWASTEPSAPAETVMNFTGCSASQATQALEQTGGDIERAVDLVLGGSGADGGSGLGDAPVSKFTIRYEHPYGRGTAEVGSSASSLEEFNSPSNMKHLKRKFAREFGCSPDELSLEVESCNINPAAGGIKARRKRPGLVDYEIEHRVREFGVWGPWGVAGVQSNARSIEEFRSARNIRQLTRQFASETGVDVGDVEVRVVGYLDDGPAPSSDAARSSGMSSSMSDQARESEEERARRLGLIDYTFEHRERHNGAWGPWRHAEVASNAPSLQEFQAPAHMRQLTRQLAASRGVDPSDCEVRAAGYADPAQAEVRGPNSTPAAQSFLPSDSVAPIPVNPNAVPSGSATGSTPPSVQAGVAQIIQRVPDCSRAEAEAALTAANGDVAKAIEELTEAHLYD